VAGGAREQLSVIYSRDGQTLEVRRPMVLGDRNIGSIRIGVSTLLMRRELNASLRPALITAAIALVVGVFVAALLAQLLLRPIHVIKSGLTRLGKGEFGVTLDLPQDDEFGDLGTYFNSISQQLMNDRDGDPKARLEAMVAYSRKLVALGRLTAGIAHEVKNPLNAMMIHLELLRTKIQKGMGGTVEHVEVIESEIRRLDEVLQGFLKFARPEDLKLQQVKMMTIFEEILPIVEPEAAANGVKLVTDCGAGVPSVNGDAAMLRQVFMNLAINACQAMSEGGTLRLTCAAAGNRVEVKVEDTGVGIPPENLGKIFDLYFTTKDHGSGIGLSMVYRIIQLHDGEVEVQSTPGRGTTFRVLLPRAT
jgi:signal transduction histidine kinase